jgi:signal transduction histidine kinase
MLHLGPDLDQLAADLHRRERDLAAISALASIRHDAGVSSLAEEVLRIVQELTGSDHVAIHLAEKDAFVMLADAGTMSGLSRRYERVPRTPESVLDGATQGVGPIRVPVAALPGEEGEQIRQAGLREAFVVPLALKHRLLGVITIVRTRDEPFSPADLRSATLIAGQAAIQIENARLYGETQQKVRQLSFLFNLTRLSTEEGEVAQLVHRALAEVLVALRCEASTLHRVENQRLVLLGCGTPALAPRLRARLESLAIDDTSLTGRTALERRTVQVSQENWPAQTLDLARGENMRYGIATPLLVKDKLIGVLMAGRFMDRPFEPEEVQLFESAASHLAVVIEHVQLFEGQRQRVRDLSVLNELGALIVQHLDLPNLLNTAVRQLARLTGVPNTFVMLLDEQQKCLKQVATNFEGSPIDVVIPLERESAATTAYHQRAPVIIHDVATDPRVDRRLAGIFAHKSLLAVPLMSSGRPLGSIILGETRPNRRFGPEDVERALAVSHQIASAIAHAQLFADLRKSYDQLAQAQAERVRNERLAALGELAAVMAHELRNPLGVVFNSVASLKKLLRPTGDAASLLGMVGEEAERLNRIVGELLEFARPGQAVLRPHRLSDIINGALAAALKAQRGDSHSVRVELQVDDALPPVLADAEMLRQALINLLTNAMQAMARGGRVVVRAALERGDGRPFARVEITDSGPGVPAELSDRIFQPFFTTKAAGTGLGLAIVKRIADAHQGEVTFAPAPGGGATFTLRLPLAA